MNTKLLRIAGALRETDETDTIRSPYDDSVAGDVAVGGAAEMDDAIAGAVAAFGVMRPRSAAGRR